LKLMERKAPTGDAGSRVPDSGPGWPWGTGESRVDYAQAQRNPGKHLTGIGIVVVLHVLLGWALVSGLARKVVEVIKAPIETKIIEEVKPPPPPETPPPPPPKMALPPPSFVPPPAVQIANPPPPHAAIPVQTPTPPRQPKRLDRTAVEALSKCKFKPGTDDAARPVGAFSIVDCVWNLEYAAARGCPPVRFFLVGATSLRLPVPLEESCP